jgi:hypothetical protein
MREAILAAHEGRLHTPPRVSTDLGDGAGIDESPLPAGLPRSWAKQVGRAEFGPELIDRADLVVTDSVAQTHAYDPPFVLVGTPQHDRLVSLGSVLAGETPKASTVVFW